MVLSRALTSYPDHYDDVLDSVHARVSRAGAATKLDLAALIAWKHVRNARWMAKLLAMPAQDVESVTRRAFAAGLSDVERVAALGPLPGFGGRGAFTSVLLTAWEPASFGVFDRLVSANRHLAVSEACTCDWAHLPTYWAHLRAIAGELAAIGEPADVEWTPRRVEMALMNLRSQS